MFPLKIFSVPWNKKKYEKDDTPLSMVFWFQKFSETPKEPSQEFVVGDKSSQQLFLSYPTPWFSISFPPDKWVAQKTFKNSRDFQICKKGPLQIFRYCETNFSLTSYYDSPKNSSWTDEWHQFLPVLSLFCISPIIFAESNNSIQ